LCLPRCSCHACSTLPEHVKSICHRLRCLSLTDAPVLLPDAISLQLPGLRALFENIHHHHLTPFTFLPVLRGSSMQPPQHRTSTTAILPCKFRLRFRRQLARPRHSSDLPAGRRAQATPLRTAQRRPTPLRTALAGHPAFPYSWQTNRYRSCCRDCAVTCTTCPHTDVLVIAGGCCGGCWDLNVVGLYDLHYTPSVPYAVRLPACLLPVLGAYWFDTNSI